MSGKETSSTSSDTRRPADRMAMTEMIGTVRRPALVEEIREALSSSRIVALSAECGMGKRSIVGELSAILGRDGLSVHVASTRNLLPVDATDVLHRLEIPCGIAAADSLDVVVIIEDLPVFDEESMGEAVLSIERFVNMGCSVLLTMEPESEMILDLLPDVCVIRAERLLVSRKELAAWGFDQGEMPYASVMRATHGIPSLVSALARRVSQGAVDGREAEDTWRGRLLPILDDAVRPALVDEERCLRLSMILLGEGCNDDLFRLGIRASRDMLEGIERDAPLFGVDLCEGTFRCVGESSRMSPSILSLVRDGWPDLVRSVVEVLLSQSRFERAGLLAVKCLSDAECESVVGAWPCELVDAGHYGLVSKVLRRWDETSHDGLEPPGLARARIACSAVGRRRSSLRSSWHQAAITEGLRGQTSWLQMRLLCASRLSRRSLEETTEPAIDSEALLEEVECSGDPMARRLAMHMRARKLLISGRIRDAYNLLVTGDEVHDATTLSSALLCDDLEVARGLLGIPSSFLDHAAQARCAGFLQREGYASVEAYMRAHRSMTDVISGRSDVLDDEEALAQRATRRRDDLSASLLLGVAALGDLRRGSLVTAHIKASKAADGASKAGALTFSNAMACLKALAEAGLGERTTGALDPRSSNDPIGMGRIANTLIGLGARSSGSTEDLPPRLDDVPCEIAFVPIVSAATGGAAGSGMRALAHEFLSLVPRGWERQVSRQRILWEGLAPHGAEHHEEVERAEEGHRQNDVTRRSGAARGRQEPSLRIEVLGTLLVRRDGEVVPESAWRRKAASALLAALAMAKGHQLSMTRVMGLLWPDSEASKAKSNVYTAVSCLKTAIGQGAGGPAFIDGSDGAIRLNPDLVTCDVDEFLKAVHDVMRLEGDDGGVVEACQRVEDVYKGEPSIPLMGQTPFARMRRGEMRRLYVDAMVAGSEAALRRGQTRQAFWFAYDAEQVDGAREDVTTCIVRSLVQMGRVAEAEEAYAEFASSLLERRGEPPSVRLRNLCLSLFGGSRQRRASHLDAAELVRSDVPQETEESASDGVERAPKLLPVMRTYGVSAAQA